MKWHVETTQRGNRALILTRDDVRYVCPLINSLAWSISALLDLSKPKE